MCTFKKDKCEIKMLFVMCEGGLAEGVIACRERRPCKSLFYIGL
jgi:hypothetical protein